MIPLVLGQVMVRGETVSNIAEIGDVALCFALDDGSEAGALPAPDGVVPAVDPAAMVCAVAALPVPVPQQGGAVLWDVAEDGGRDALQRVGRDAAPERGGSTLDAADRGKGLTGSDTTEGALPVALPLALPVKLPVVAAPVLAGNDPPRLPDVPDGADPRADSPLASPAPIGRGDGAGAQSGAGDAEQTVAAAPLVRAPVQDGSSLPPDGGVEFVPDPDSQGGDGPATGGGGAWVGPANADQSRPLPQDGERRPVKARDGVTARREGPDRPQDRGDMPTPAPLAKMQEMPPDSPPAQAIPLALPEGAANRLAPPPRLSRPVTDIGAVDAAAPRKPEWDLPDRPMPKQPADGIAAPSPPRSAGVVQVIGTKERPHGAEVPAQGADALAALPIARDPPAPPAKQADAPSRLPEAAVPVGGPSVGGVSSDVPVPVSGDVAPQGDVTAAAPAAAPAPVVDGTVAHRPAAMRHDLPPTVPAALVQQAQAGVDGPVTLTLSPEDLGPLRFEMQGRGDAIHVALVVERPETLDLLRRHSDQLVAEFRQAGFSGASFSFSGTGGQDRGSPRPAYYRADEGDGEIVTVKPRRPARDGLDLRL